MTTDEYEKWVRQARAHSKERMESATHEFGLGTYKRYDVDLPTAKIRFSDEQGATRVSADIQVAGSWSPNSDSWMWSWENESMPAAACARVEAVKQFGEKNDIDELKSSFPFCDEGKAWSMASAAAEILGAECPYRVVQPKSYVFLLLFSIRKN
jgi:hypothetical protein